MAIPLLRTRFSVPRPRADIVARPHLCERLTESLSGKLSLISAPAGFGKSTLLSEWADSTECPVAWLSLAPGENDPVRFLTYLIAAFQTVDSALGRGSLELLQAPRHPPLKSLLIALINDIDAKKVKITLILDDIQQVEERAVYEQIQFLLENIPINLHVVMSGRIDPPLPLAHLRAKAQLTEMRAADLRFSLEEAARFLNDLLGLQLSAEMVTALWRRTEGWIVGLQLAALSLRETDDRDGFIKTFTGTHRFIIDFLVEEIMSHQDQNTAQFLLYTSVLDRFTPDLCDAVLGISGSRQLIEQIVRANLFLIPLDEERQWFRYHQLFAEFLRQRLGEMRSDRIPELHLLASRWYRQNGLAEEAAEHALAAGDPELAAEIVDGLAVEYWNRGEPSTLLKWMRRLPLDNVRNRAALAVHCAWVLFLNGRNEEAQRLLGDAESTVAMLGESDRHLPGSQPASAVVLESSNLLGRIAAIRSAIAFRQGNAPAIFEHSQQALALLDNHKTIWGAIAATNLGFAQDFSGDTAAACETVARAVEVSKACDNTYMILSTSLHLGTLLMSRGNLPRVHEMCRDLMALAEQRGVLNSEMAGCLYDELGLVLCEWNRMDEARQFLHRGSALSERGYDTGVLGWSYLTMIRALFTQGDLAGAMRTVAKMDRLEHEFDVPPWYTGPKEAWRARVLLAQGQNEAADRWAHERGLSAAAEIPYLREEEHIAFARIHLEQGRFADCQQLLGRIIANAERGGRMEVVARCLLINALALRAQQDTDSALVVLDRALTLTEPGGYVRIYVDEGAAMADLLREIESGRTTSDYVGRLLAAFDGGEPATPSALAEPLTARERQVLRMLASELSGPEIADELSISANTLRTHTRNLYGKLDAHNRRQAVAIAEEFGLI